MNFRDWRQGLAGRPSNYKFLAYYLIFLVKTTLGFVFILHAQPAQWNLFFFLFHRG